VRVPLTISDFKFQISDEGELPEALVQELKRLVRDAQHRRIIQEAIRNGAGLEELQEDSFTGITSTHGRAGMPRLPRRVGRARLMS
jgi:hypothetical protein